MNHYSNGERLNCSSCTEWSVDTEEQVDKSRLEFPHGKGVESLRKWCENVLNTHSARSAFNLFADATRESGRIVGNYLWRKREEMESRFREVEEVLWEEEEQRMRGERPIRSVAESIRDTDRYKQVAENRQRLEATWGIPQSFGPEVISWMQYVMRYAINSDEPQKRLSDYSEEYIASHPGVSMEDTQSNKVTAPPDARRFLWRKALLQTWPWGPGNDRTKAWYPQNAIQFLDWYCGKLSRENIPNTDPSLCDAFTEFLHLHWYAMKAEKAMEKSEELPHSTGENNTVGTETGKDKATPKGKREQQIQETQEKRDKIRNDIANWETDKPFPSRSYFCEKYGIRQQTAFDPSSSKGMELRKFYDSKREERKKDNRR